MSSDQLYRSKQKASHFILIDSILYFNVAQEKHKRVLIMSQSNIEKLEAKKIFTILTILEIKKSINLQVNISMGYNAFGKVCM